jgi:hypothetical protein
MFFRRYILHFFPHALEEREIKWVLVGLKNHVRERL